MPLDPICNIFQPVAERVISLADSLIGLEGQSPTLGLEGWLKIEAVRALGSLVTKINNNGPGKPPQKTPDLYLQDGDTTIGIELKGANDLNPSYLRRGVTDHLQFHNFGGCIFLGDGTSHVQINKLTTDVVELVQSRKFEAGKKTWIIGLLTPKAS